MQKMGYFEWKDTPRKSPQSPHDYLEWTPVDEKNTISKGMPILKLNNSTTHEANLIQSLHFD